MKTNLLKKSIAALMIVGVGFAYSCNGSGDAAKTGADSTKVAPATPVATPVDTTAKKDTTAAPAAADTAAKKK